MQTSLPTSLEECWNQLVQDYQKLSGTAMSSVVAQAYKTIFFAGINVGFQLEYLLGLVQNPRTSDMIRLGYLEELLLYGLTHLKNKETQQAETTQEPKIPSDAH